MKSVKKALYSKVTGDATIQAKLGNQAFYEGRLPDTAVVSKSVAAMSLDGATDLDSGDTQSMTFTLSVYSLSHDLVEDVYADIRRIFHPTQPRRFWVPLVIAEGDQAFVRVEGAFDVHDPASEFAHKAVRLRVLFAKKFP